MDIRISIYIIFLRRPMWHVNMYMVYACICHWQLCYQKCVLQTDYLNPLWVSLLSLFVLLNGLNHIGWISICYFEIVVYYKLRRNCSDILSCRVRPSGWSSRPRFCYSTLVMLQHIWYHYRNHRLLNTIWTFVFRSNGNRTFVTRIGCCG